MKKIIVPSGNYTFVAESGVVTLSGAAYTSLLNKESLLLITNTTSNNIIYNPYCNGYGGVVDTISFTITLELDTSSMDNNDNLQVILYDNGAIEVEQSAHDDLNANVNVQVGDADVDMDNPIPVTLGDTFNIDAFGRLRTSSLTTQFDGKQLHDALPLYYDVEEVATGAAAHSTVNTESTLTTAASSDAVIMQTKQRFNYMTGKSALGMQTFRSFHNEINITKRVGYFNSSSTTPFTTTYDGFYLEADGTNINFVVAKGGSKNTIAQSSWNGDKLDGTGASGIDLDLGTETGNLLMWWQYEWLGVGAVTFGFVFNGAFIKCHREDHILGDGVYMESPNHSLRAEIRQSGAGSGVLRYICSTFNTEGALDTIGKILSDNLGTATVNANTVGTKYALLGITLQSAKVDTLVDILDYSILSITADNQLVELWLNPTVAGTFTYSAITNSSVAVAKGDTAGNPSANTVTGGTLLYSDYISSQQSFNIQVQNAVRLGMTIAGITDILVLTTTPLSSNSDVTASIKWRELS